MSISESYLLAHFTADPVPHLSGRTSRAYALTVQLQAHYQPAILKFCFPLAAELQGAPNVILTPHIGGSTEEAQAAIGQEVALALAKYVSTGATAGAVNFPQASCVAPTSERCHDHHHTDAAGTAAVCVIVVSILGQIC